MAHQVLPADMYGVTDAPDRRLSIGGIELPVWSDRIPVYQRCGSSDLAIGEIELAAHDGPHEEELDHLNVEADRYPLGRRSTGDRGWLASTPADRIPNR